ncbi:hypothetical protein SRHO_G00247360 [Serrasalmus rhombeus]
MERRAIGPSSCEGELDDEGSDRTKALFTWDFVTQLQLTEVSEEGDLRRSRAEETENWGKYRGWKSPSAESQRKKVAPSFVVDGSRVDAQFTKRSLGAPSYGQPSSSIFLHSESW